MIFNSEEVVSLTVDLETLERIRSKKQQELYTKFDEGNYTLFKDVLGVEEMKKVITGSESKDFKALFKITTPFSNPYILATCNLSIASEATKKEAERKVIYVVRIKSFEDVKKK